MCVGVSSSHSTTYITCPADPKKTLGIKLPFLVMIIKNLKKYFTFEVQVSVCPGACTLWAAPEASCRPVGEAPSEGASVLSFAFPPACSVLLIRP